MTFAQPFSDYEILERVGAGAMGTVFRARHKKLGRTVALKVLRPSLARNERYVDRLRREARIVASLNHPNIVAGYDLGEEGGYHFFVMEFVEGKSLRALLGEWGMFPEEKVLDVARQVATALDHAFQLGIIHRDIKPGNIIIDEKGRVKLTDMGLAKGPTDLTLTRDGATVGTPQYISPEQARTPQDIDVRGDLYSLGATLYHMATGQPPFRGETLAEVITKVLHEPVGSPQDLNQELSDGMSLVIRKLLAKNIAVRYQTPRELLDDLQRIAEDKAPAVDPGRLLAAELGVGRPRWRRAAVIGALVLAAVAGVVIGNAMRGDPEERTDAVGPYFARLDAELSGAATWGERWQRLKAASAAAPAGAQTGLQSRQAQITNGIQRAVDGAAQSFLVEQRADTEQWLRQPARWPSQEDFARERLAPAVRLVSGLAPEALPTAVDRGDLDALLVAVGDLIRRRNEDLFQALEGHLERTLGREADGVLRTGDFAGAERLWDQGLQAFADGAAQPRLEVLEEGLRQEVRRRYGAVMTAARERLGRAEAEAGEALSADAEGGLRALGERLTAGASVATLRSGLARLKAGLQSAHPAPERFRLGADPWPTVERRVAAFERDLDLLAHEVEQGRVGFFLDLVYRCVVTGALTEADDLLRELRSDDPTAIANLQRHRALVAAADAVEQALLADLSGSREALQGFPRNAPLQPVPLRVVRRDDRLSLTVEPLGAPPRTAKVGEFLLQDLLQRAQRAGADALNGIPAQDRAAGLLLLAMSGDDLTGMAARLRDAGDEFLLEEVWPRVLRLRGEGGDAPGPDRRAIWAQVLAAWQLARETGDHAGLETVLLAFRGRFADSEMEQPEQRELQAVTEWLRHAKARSAARQSLRAAAPPGAEVAVEGDEGALSVTVDLPWSVLRKEAPEGWAMVDRPVPMLSAAGVPLPDQGRRALVVAAGLPTGLAECGFTATFWVSPVAKERVWLLEFRGVGVLLTMAADGSVGAALLDPHQLPQKDALQRGLHRAMRGFLAEGPRPRGVPGALHRLTVEIDTPPGRARSTVRVVFEGAELVTEVRELDSRAAPVLRVLPSQDVGFVSARLRGKGL